MADLLQSFLADRDTPCPGCSYNLRGLTTDRCPECNQHLSLRVGLTDPRMGWFMGAVVGAASGLGLSGLLLIYLLLQVMTRGWASRGMFHYFMWHNLIGAAVHGGLLAMLLLRSSRYRRAALWSRVALAAAMWGLTLLNIVLFSVLVK